jgi:uncharacterized protein (TIGR00369 family)
VTDDGFQMDTLAGEGWRPFEDEGFISFTGPIFHHEEDTMRYCFIPDERHRNRNNAVHGGMLMTFADRAFGTVCHQAAEGPVVTVQMDSYFTQIAELGRPIFISCRVIRKARSLIFIDGDCTQDDRIVATMRGVFKILPR